MTQYILSPNAQTSLRKIKAYSLEQFGEEQTITYLYRKGISFVRAGKLLNSALSGGTGNWAKGSSGSKPVRIGRPRTTLGNFDGKQT